MPATATPSQATVRGIVSLPGLGPCEGCDIGLATGGQGWRTTSGAGGSYTLKVPPGTYDVYYFCPDVLNGGDIAVRVDPPMNVTVFSGDNTVNITSGFCY